MSSVCDFNLPIVRFGHYQWPTSFYSAELSPVQDFSVKDFMPITPSPLFFSPRSITHLNCESPDAKRQRVAPQNFATPASPLDPLKDFIVPDAVLAAFLAIPLTLPPPAPRRRSAAINLTVLIPK